MTIRSLCGKIIMYGNDFTVERGGIVRRSDFIDKIVPISALNQGQAAKVLNRVTNEHEVLIMKNNQLKAVIISPEQYQSFCALAEECSGILNLEELPNETAQRIRMLLKKTKLYASD